ncbi:hypothetical protein D8W73_01735 [Citrobacter amalonaticus]|nr:hypothetical protein [Citrobacter amalonaticus]
MPIILISMGKSREELKGNADKSTAPAGAVRLLTKKEKTWFFLLCGYQPKINQLIFLVFN